MFAANATEMVAANTLFKKRDSRLVTYKSGNSSSQLDYVLVRKSYRKMVKDVKGVTGEECAPQHKLVVCDLIIKSVRRKLKDLLTLGKIENKKSLLLKQNSVQMLEKKKGVKVEDKWYCLRSVFLKLLIKYAGALRSQVTWWWNAMVDNGIKEKRREDYVKSGKLVVLKESYLESKRKARSEVYAAKKQAEEERYIYMRL